MRIGIFTDTYYPQINGLAISALTLNNHLTAKGHEVYVVTTTDPGTPGAEKDVFRIPSVPFLGERRMGMFYHSGVARKVQGLGLDLIHTQTEFCLGCFGRRLARQLQIPFIHTMHTMYEEYTHYVVKWQGLEGVGKALARKISRDFCNSADRVIAPTDKVRQLLQSYGVAKDIAVVPTGIELERFRPQKYGAAQTQALRKAIGIKAEEKVLLYVGRLEEEKNLDELIIGLAGYLKEKKSLRFLLVGDGTYRKRLERLAREQGLTEQIVFAGARPWDEIGRYYQMGDIFVTASHSESQGLTYIEAMAAGLPLLVKQDPCLKKVLQEGVNGYTFQDAHSLCQALDRLLSDEPGRKKLALGSQRSAEQYSAEVFAAAVEQLYQEMLVQPKVSAQYVESNL